MMRVTRSDPGTGARPTPQGLLRTSVYEGRPCPDLSQYEATLTPEQLAVLRNPKATKAAFAEVLVQPRKET